MTSRYRLHRRRGQGCEALEVGRVVSFSRRAVSTPRRAQLRPTGARSVGSQGHRPVTGHAARNQIDGARVSERLRRAYFTLPPDR